MKRLKEIGNYKLKRYFRHALNEAGREKISLYLNRAGENIGVDPDNPEKNSDAIEKAHQRSNQELLGIMEEDLLKGTDSVSLRIQKLFTVCGDNEIAKTLFELSTLLKFDHGASKALHDLGITSSERDGISVQFAAEVCGYSLEDAKTIQLMAEAYDCVSLFLHCEEGDFDQSQQFFRVDEGLVKWLAGIDELTDSMKEHGKLLFSSELEENASHIYGLSECFSDFGRKLLAFQEEEPVIASICGERGSGRKSCAGQIAIEFQKPLFIFPADTILLADDLRGIIKEIIRNCYLHDAICCIEDVPMNKMLLVFIEEWNSRAACLNTPLLLTGYPDVKLLPFFENVCELKLDEIKYEQYVQIWEGLLKENGLENAISVQKVVSKMRLTPGQIYLVVRNLRRYVMQVNQARQLNTVGEHNNIEGTQNKEADNRNAETVHQNMKTDQQITETELYKICYQILDDSRYENVKRVKSGFSLDDLKISNRNRNILKRVCDQASNRETVYRSWGMDKKYTYGRCISLLLAGPPGTGKTMAVHAMASELGLELYKVDLSQITDKYIGGSHKRLEEVFQRAEKSNLILFFDEADAVLGKRSETKDSHDKYANGEIAFILQRMEEYDGIVILATNYLQNIDSAFMRRIRYVVNFEKPQAEVRKEIWMSAFAEGVPRAADIDFDFLAEKFELSGGNIKNIVLNAVFQAAAEDVPVDMMHIMQAIYLENTKDKRFAFADDYGHYGAFLRQNDGVSGDTC